MSKQDKPIAGLYWTLEDIDSACQVYAIHIAVTNHLVCTIDTDVPSAETFANLFALAPKLLEACDRLLMLIDHETDLPRSARNGVTDSTGTVDEGEVRAAEIVENARNVVAEVRLIVAEDAAMEVKQ